MTIDGRGERAAEESRASEALGRALDALRPPFDTDMAVSLAVPRSSEAAAGGADVGAPDGTARQTLGAWPRRRVLRWAVPVFAGGPIVAALLFAARPTPPPLPTIVRIADLQRTAEVRRPSAAVGLPRNDDPRSPAEVDERPAASGSSEDGARLASFSIDAPESGQVAVFQTRNPRIRVVWFYDEEGSED